MTLEVRVSAPPLVASGPPVVAALKPGVVELARSDLGKDQRCGGTGPAGKGPPVDNLLPAAETRRRRERTGRAHLPADERGRELGNGPRLARRGSTSSAAATISGSGSSFRIRSMRWIRLIERASLAPALLVLGAVTLGPCPGRGQRRATALGPPPRTTRSQRSGEQPATAFVTASTGSSDMTDRAIASPAVPAGAVGSRFEVEFRDVSSAIRPNSLHVILRGTLDRRSGANHSSIRRQPPCSSDATITAAHRRHPHGRPPGFPRARVEADHFQLAGGGGGGLERRADLLRQAQSIRSRCPRPNRPPPIPSRDRRRTGRSAPPGPSLRLGAPEIAGGSPPRPCSWPHRSSRVHSLPSPRQSSPFSSLGQVGDRTDRRSPPPLDRSGPSPPQAPDCRLLPASVTPTRFRSSGASMSQLVSR